MHIVETILNHKSIRSFKPDIIPAEVMNEILAAGSRASTTGNMQVYSVVVTKNQKIKNQLWESHFKQEMVKQAPVVLTFCADFNRFNKWCKVRQAVPGYDNFLSFFTAAIDALLAAQNVAIAAEAHKLGICYLGTTTYMAEKIIDILNLPKFVVPVTTLVVGYPANDPGLTDRLPLHGVIHNETYTDYSTEQIDEIYSEKESMELTRQLLKENNKETLAQVFTDNRYTKKDNVAFSQALLSVLKKQGFMNNEIV
ncbi:MAG: nitroreductase family protein [Bacteroidales bacterium]|nr:nitroreductase family protein [Bacteroidales bacterium]MBN2818243.1 nitroreductase family protein [Bacteroidales bacterium]